ncbi:uncharacterized protein EHS24_006700 [Apiotrichum porosum]|uniref:L-arabinitol 4-dehydrogenase n=1 Tax=Apiotrichum porosum TaxID=105984 RepID=A0A427Y201_9TREE|nr:uncharacterized protein EHS24_006700 [Apiotrichum porosum]RSH85107.1 hypothetical protein EHS24_006700 [Apiotrichum porosum]
MSEIGTLPPNAMEQHYNGFQKIDYSVLSPGAAELADGTSNIKCAYTPELEMKMLLFQKPAAGPEEVVIHLRAAGICGSDVHFWKDGRIADSVVSQPCCAGHESAGEVIEVGANWKDKINVGDRVALEMGIPCGKPDCEECLSGGYNGCPHTVFFSTPPYHGTLGRYPVHPGAWVHKLPDNVSYTEGALCEPLCVALAGIERGGVKLADPVVIALATLLAARAAGAAPVVITDVVESRLDFARTLVPGVRTVLINPAKSPQEIAAEVRTAAGLPVKIVLECTGMESSIHAATYIVSFGGHVHIIGVGKSIQTFRYIRQAIRLVSEGLVNILPLVTHNVPLAEAVSAFNVAADPSQGAIKVHIVDN